MDRQTLALFIPILLFSIPVVGIVFGGLIKLARIKAEQQRALPDDETLARLESLEHDVEVLRRQLGEAQERIDFAERMLARPRTESPPA